MKIKSNNKGQILIEIILAILIGTMIIGSAANLIITNQKNSQISEQQDTAVFLAQEGVESLKSIVKNNWHWIFLPPDSSGDEETAKGDGNNYCLKTTNNEWVLTNITADCEIEVNGTIYTRIINFENVNRTDDNNENIVLIGGIRSPSTQKATITVSSKFGPEIIIEQYLTRWKNEIFVQSNWSGGAGDQGPYNSNDIVTSYNSDDGNIDTSNGYLKLKSL